LPTPAVAFDVTPLQNAHRHRGIGTYVRGLATRLAEQDGVPIEFWGWSGDVPLTVNPPHRAIWLRRFPMPRYRGAWFFARAAMRMRARGSSVRAVHITDPDALTLLPPRKILATVYDLIRLKQGFGRREMIGRAGYDGYLKALTRADGLFAISNQTAADVAGLLSIPAPRILVAKPGIDLVAPSSPPAPRARPFFLYVGGPNPNKNLAVLLDAMAMCTDLNEELLIAGQWLPQQVAALEARTSEESLRSRVRHLGFVPDTDLAVLMRDATGLVVPSLVEGFGLPVGEGLAAGALVIHSRLSVLEETSAGAALTFDAHSAPELAACLRRAAGDGAEMTALRRRGVERAKQLTWDDAVQVTLGAYRAMIEQ